MTLKDNWQGEFSVALFGALGYAAGDVFIPLSVLMSGRPQFPMLVDLVPAHIWALWFFVFAVLQLCGLLLPGLNGRHMRIGGAVGICVGMTCVFIATLIKAPYAGSLPAYLVCIFIEFCAIIFHISHVVRFGEYPRWRWIMRH